MKTTLAILFCAAALLLPDLALGREFIAGADVSHLAFFEERGIVYRDGGDARDALAILKSRGLNCVRLRLFTSSSAQAAADPYNCLNNLEYAVSLAVRVKNAGLRFMLDFHYSDTWADPGHQAKPAAWTNLLFGDLVQEVRSYNSNCVAAFIAAGARPDYVQVGNEITSGLLWPDGRVGGAYDTPAQWWNLGQLLKAAVQGIQDAAGAQAPAIVIHIDRGGSWSGTQWFFDHLAAQQVPFDIIGESYYPFWHGSLQDLRTCLTNAASRYQKPVLVAETAFPWSSSTNILGIPATPEGQVQYLAALAQVVEGIPRQMGAGIVWWGAEYQRLDGYRLAGFDTKSFFDFTGSVLPIADAFGQLLAPLQLRTNLEGDTLALRWPLSGAGCRLMTATNLGLAATWLPVTNTVQNSGLLFGADLPLDRNLGRYYRLQAD